MAIKKKDFKSVKKKFSAEAKYKQQKDDENFEPYIASDPKN